jgi:hypothetical protein
MKLNDRIDLLVRLGEHMHSGDEGWAEARKRASYQNAWFLPEFVDRASSSIATEWLNRAELESAAVRYGLNEEPIRPMTVGVVMAGNIPMVGFHDFLCVFLSGHLQKLKPSSKDDVLIPYLVKVLSEWSPEVNDRVGFGDMLKGCDAYIATGSNNTARYFEQYFARFPHIIRRNRTSVAVLEGTETKEELDLLADDIQLYFGLGCRNVTKILVPENYDFVPLLGSLKKYGYLMELHKYKNNIDYALALHIINNKFYMTNGEIVLSENPSPFSPIGQLNYESYLDRNEAIARIDPENLQCLVGKGGVPFGSAQRPGFTDFADGVDTLAFLKGL